MPVAGLTIAAPDAPATGPIASRASSRGAGAIAPATPRGSAMRGRLATVRLPAGTTRRRRPAVTHVRPAASTRRRSRRARRAVRSSAPLVEREDRDAPAVEHDGGAAGGAPGGELPADRPERDRRGLREAAGVEQRDAIALQREQSPVAGGRDRGHRWAVEHDAARLGAIVDVDLDDRVAGRRVAPPPGRARRHARHRSRHRHPRDDGVRRQLDQRQLRGVAGDEQDARRGGVCKRQGQDAGEGARQDRRGTRPAKSLHSGDGSRRAAPHTRRHVTPRPGYGRLRVDRSSRRGV